MDRGNVCFPERWNVWIITVVLRRKSNTVLDILSWSYVCWIFKLYLNVSITIMYTLCGWFFFYRYIHVLIIFYEFIFLNKVYRNDNVFYNYVDIHEHVRSRNECEWGRPKAAYSKLFLRLTPSSKYQTYQGQWYKIKTSNILKQ